MRDLDLLPKPKVRGIAGPIPQPLSFDYDKRDGIAVDEVQRGTVATMKAFSYSLRAQRISHRYEETGDGHANVYIRTNQIPQDPFADAPIDSWDMPGQEDDLDIFEHPDVIAMEAANPGIIGVIRHAVKDYNEAEEVGYSFAPALNNPTNEALAVSVFNKVLTGNTHIKKPRHTLRHRQTVSENYSSDILADVTGTERIYTAAQLLDECASFDYPLPARLVRKIGTIANNGPSVPSGYVYGWRKLPSTEATVAGGKIEVSTEYILELWGCPFPYLPK